MTNSKSEANYQNNNSNTVSSSKDEIPIQNIYYMLIGC